MIDSRDKVTLYHITSGGGSWQYSCPYVRFDNSGGIWAYSWTYALRHYAHNLSLLGEIYDGNDFMYDLSAELDGTGVWYTDKVENLVVHRNTSGTILQTIILPQPRAICGTPDNGCWVADNSEGLIRRYSFSAQLTKTFDYPEGVNSISRMTDDMVGGFWFIADANWVYHITSDGLCDTSGVYTQAVDFIYPIINGCVVFDYDDSTRKVSVVELGAGAVTKTWSNVSNRPISGVGVFSLDISKAIEYNFPMDGGQAPTYIPASYDTVWGKTDGILEWKEVRKDGYYLPKHKYHQVEVTLRDNATLEKIIMAPAIRTQDIQSKSYKNIYLKTDVPGDAIVDAYEARLKTWWGVND
jgi:hypothetical protein